MTERPGHIYRGGSDPLHVRRRSSAMPEFAWLLRPLVDFVAGIRVSVHTKLLAGFLTGALLLTVMGAVSLGEINRISSSFTTVTLQQEKVDLARQMESAITAQTRFRAITLLTGDDSNDEKIAGVQERFLKNLRRVDEISENDAI